MRRVWLMTVAVGLAALIALPASVLSASRPRAEAVLVDGSHGRALVVAAAGSERWQETGSPARPGVEVGSGSVFAVSAQGDGTPATAASARARAVARSVVLLDGLVTAREVRRTASSTPAGERQSGIVRKLRIAGVSLGDVVEGRSFELPGGAGTVAVNVGDHGLVVRLDRAHGRLPAGTALTVASVRASAPAAEPAAAADESAQPPTASASPNASPDPARERAPAAPRAEPSPEEADRTDETSPRAPRGERPWPDPLAEALDRLTGGSFAFPVHGSASVSDSFGAARPQGAHQGNDIFADLGAPVLAVADGTVERVGTLPISGNRLWLRTEAGDAFFYAHLSAFAPAAVDGRRVRAGTVLGFVGNTGDAEPTPPHVHFEIHPGGGVAIDPFHVLAAWERDGEVRRDPWLARHSEDSVPRPGALVPVRDFIAAG